MTGARIAVIWDKPIVLTRLIEDCGHSCELVTPHLLTAPFFKKNFNGILIPAGFASPDSGVVLAALRAIECRISRFIEEGGTLLTFGGAFLRNDVYNWLPVEVDYRFGFSTSMITKEQKEPSPSIVEDISEPLTIDGVIRVSSGKVILSSPQGAVMVCVTYGKGKIIITSLHEYPSRRFITETFSEMTEGLL
jgi:hypothetical protein